MSDTEILKEFLAKLGFQVDERSFNKFQAYLTGSTKEVFKLGGSMVAVAVAAETFSYKLSESLDKLYFASKRTGASASEINAYDYSISQLGGTVEGAQGSLENLAQFMRENFADGILTSMFGVRPEHLNDTKKAMDDIAIKLAHMNQTGMGRQAWALSKMIGLDANTTLAMMDNSYLDKQKEYNEMLAKSGVDLEALTKSGHEAHNQFSALWVTLGLVADRIGTVLIPVVKLVNTGLLNMLGGSTVSPEEAAAHPNAVRVMAKYGADINGYRLVPTQNATPSNMNNDSGPNKPSVANMPYSGLAGWTPQQLAGIIANLFAESGMDPKKIGDHGQAYGIAQWHPDRQKNFEQWSGHDIHGSSLAEQLNFVQYELTQGTFKAAGEALKRTGSARDAGEVVSSLYERPADSSGQRLLRGNMADRLYQQAAVAPVTVSQTTNISVNGESSPHATATAIGDEQSRVNGQLVRNVIGNVQ